MGQGHSAEALANRPLDFPLNLSSEAQIYALAAVPKRHLATMEISGRVFQHDYNKTVVGWVDGNGYAFRNDFNRLKVGCIDLSSRKIYQADYDKTLIGRVDEEGNVYLCGPGVHVSHEDKPVGKIEGGSDGVMYATCALLLLF